MNTIKTYLKVQFRSSKKQNIRQNILKGQSGFTLIEILIALTLIALAGTFVAGKFFDNLHEGQVNSAKIQMSNLDGRLKEYRRKCGSYPTELEALITKPSGGRECKDYPQGGFIEDSQVPKDPWEHDFIYESDGKTFNISSLGSDGEVGGTGPDADISLRPGAKGASSAPKEAPAEAAPAPEAAPGGPAENGAAQ